ncbi:MAG: hypothetical protein ACXVJ7_16250 [Acidimicrobiia bacterium]
MSHVGVVELVVVLVPLALVVLAITRNRPTTSRFGSVNGLDLDAPTERRVAATLARTRRGRIAGAWVGGALGIVAGVGLNDLTGLATGWTVVLSATAGILAGTFVGIAGAQGAPRRDPASLRRASLTVRDVDAYRTPHGTALVRGAVTVFLAAVGLVLVATIHDVTITVVAPAVIAAGGLAFVVWARQLSVGIVEMARDLDDPVGAAVDDCLRSCAIRSIQHATVGLLACGIGLLALLGLNTQTYEAVKVGGRTAFQVPDGGRLVSVSSEPDVSVRVSRTTTVTIRWTDPDGVDHTTTRPLPPTAYLASGTFAEHDVVLSLAGLGFVVGWIVAIGEWSRAAKTWRRPAPPRLGPPATPRLEGST